MNNTKRCMVLVKALDKIYKEYLKSMDFINNSLEEVFRNENFLLHHVFSVCSDFLSCCLCHNLWLAIFYYKKPRTEKML